MLNNDGERSKPGFLYAMPFVIAIFNIAVSIKKPKLNVSQASIAFSEDPTQLIILGTSYLLALLCVLSRPVRTLSVISNHRVYFLLLGFMLLSMLWSYFPAKVFIIWGHLFGFTITAISAYYYYENRTESFIGMLAYYCIVILTASIAVSILLPRIGTDSMTGRWQGISGNANLLGIISFIGVWVSLAGYRFSRRMKKYLIVFALSMVCLWGSRSATSIMISGFIMGFFVLFILFKSNHSFSSLVFRGSILLTISIMIIVLIYTLDPSILTSEGISRISGRDLTLTGRWKLWREGLDIFLAKPLLGWSNDALLSVYARQNIVQGQFHNGYLDVAIRGGIAGFLLVIALCTKVFSAAKRLFDYEPYISLVFVALFLGILIHNITEASLVRAPNILWLLFIFVYFSVCELSVAKKKMIVDAARNGLKGPTQTVDR